MIHPNDLDRRAVALAAKKEQCRRSLAEFTRQAWHVLEPATQLKWGWALDAICEHLEAVTAGEILRLLINVPPGSMKSLLVGVFWPAWEWGPRGMPHMRYLGTAHKQDLAVRDNMKCRRLIQSGWYQERWPIQFTGDQNAKTKFENSRTGFREAMAFGSLTGSRGGRVIFDDPHSVDDANSPTILGGDVRTFREALPSRVEDEKSAIIGIMQRLNEGDIAGVALDLGYDHLCIPMRWENDRDPPIKTTSIGWKDPRRRQGALMFPERFPESQVLELEKSLGSYASAGQLQQNPKARSGGMFEKGWFEIVDAAPVDLDLVRAWDLAASVPEPGKDPDSTARVKMGRCPDGFFWIMNAEKFQKSAANVRTELKNTASQDGKLCRIRIPQDPGQAGKAQAQEIIRMLAGYAVKAVPPTGNKETRATPLSAQAEAGNVKLLKGPWIEAFLDELTMFPFGKHDDLVDAAADAFNELADPADSSGFLALVRQDNQRAEAKRKEAASESAAAAEDGGECPYPKGSLEYLRWHGLVS